MATRCKVAVSRVAEVSATWPTTSGSLPFQTERFLLSIKTRQRPAVELRLLPRGRRSAVRAGIRVFATYMRGQALSPTGERAALFRMMVS